MTTLALSQTRSLFSAFRLPWPVSPFAFPVARDLARPILQPLLDLLPAIVLAVPKSKVSHSRKSMRSANKGLKDKQNIVNCPACGAAKLAHHACRGCYDSIIAKSRQQSRLSQVARGSSS